MVNFLNLSENEINFFNNRKGLYGLSENTSNGDRKVELAVTSFFVFKTLLESETVENLQKKHLSALAMNFSKWIKISAISYCVFKYCLFELEGFIFSKSFDMEQIKPLERSSSISVIEKVKFFIIGTFSLIGFGYHKITEEIVLKFGTTHPKKSPIFLIVFKVCIRSFFSSK